MCGSGVSGRLALELHHSSFSLTPVDEHISASLLQVLTRAR